jgi:hypothetical protein
MTTKKDEKTKVKVSEEVAEQDFERFAEYWDIDTETETMSPEDRDSFEGQKSRILRAIKNGRAAIGDDGKLTYKLREPIGEYESLTFKLPRGDAFISMDKHKERQSMHKIQTLIAGMTGVPSSLLSRLNGIDMKFGMGVASLFLAS